MLYKSNRNGLSVFVCVRPISELICVLKTNTNDMSVYVFISISEPIIIISILIFNGSEN